MKRSISTLIGAALAGVALLAHAHEDQPITWQPDGSLVGLPAAYRPANLQAGFAAVDGAARLTALRLRIGNRGVLLPSCLLGSLESERREQLSLSASWDHDEGVVPYYLALHAADADGYYELLFNLHTAKLMSMSFHLQSGGRNFPIDLHERCAADELAGVVDR